jgi:hypothetical protein
MNLPLYDFIIGVAFLTGLFTLFRSATPFHLRAFVIFLFITFIIEIIGFYIQLRLHRNNTAIYNLFTVFEFSFYFYLLHEEVLNKKAKRIIFYIGWAYALLALINIFFIQGIKIFHTMTYSLGCFLIAAVCIYFFLELFQRPRSVNLTAQPAFWICSGLLFFYSCSFPLFAFANFVTKLPPIILKSLGYVLNLLNVLLYSSFTIAFLCRLKVRKSTS